MDMVFILIGAVSVSTQLMKGISWLDNGGLKKKNHRMISQEKERTLEEAYQRLATI